jgi:hypothetical protein
VAYRVSRNKALLFGIIIAMGAYLTSQTLTLVLGPLLIGSIVFVGPVLVVLTVQRQKLN